MIGSLATQKMLKDHEDTLVGQKLTKVEFVESKSGLFIRWTFERGDFQDIQVQALK